MLWENMHFTKSGATLFGGPPVCPIPTKDIVCKVLECENHRIFTDGKWVFKLFDTQIEGLFQPNEELLRTAGLTDVSVTYLSKDSRLKMLQYSYIPGNHSPKRVEDFKGAVIALNKVHSFGYIWASGHKNSRGGMYILWLCR